MVFLDAYIYSCAWCHIIRGALYRNILGLLTVKIAFVERHGVVPLCVVVAGGLTQRLVELELEDVRGEEAHVVHALGHVAPRPEVKVVLVALVRRGDACA